MFNNPILSLTKFFRVPYLPLTVYVVLPSIENVPWLGSTPAPAKHIVLGSGFVSTIVSSLESDFTKLIVTEVFWESIVQIIVFRKFEYSFEKLKPFVSVINMFEYYYA